MKNGMVIERPDACDESRKLRRLISRLYDADVEKRFMAATALGEYAAANPGSIKQTWNRIFYAFDDTMSCWGIAEGLGEIARNVPELRSRILTLLRKFSNDEVSCQGFVWAVCRIGQVERRLIEGFIPDLMRFLDSDAVCMVGQTIWALGELGIPDAYDIVRAFFNDTRKSWIFENDRVRIRIIGDVAKDALEKMGMRK